MYMGLSANNSNMVIISPKRTLCLPSSFLKLHKNHPSSTKTIILNPLLVHNNYGLNINSNAARIGTSTSTSTSTSTTIISASSSAARTLPDPDADADADVVVVESNNTTATTSTKWSEFATKVSGEWDGYGADFTKDGEPIELPESVVPEAYREWEVKVFDWQTQCPTLAQQKHEVEVEVEVDGDGDGDSLLIYKFIKLLPTVGCEADAATRYNIDVRIVGGAHTNVSAFAYQPTTGCYVAVWPILDQGHPYRLLELEYCLMDPRNQESPSRVRIIQVVRVQNNTKLVLQNIKIFCEQWYGPFRNGDQLGGCAIRDSAFASTQALKSSEIIGVWQGPHAVANFKNSQTNIIQQLVDGSVRTSVRNESNLVLLPKQLWCSVEEIEDDETCFEVGWLLDQGRAITSKCILSSNANLKEIAVASEAAALAQ